MPAARRERAADGALPEGLGPWRSRPGGYLRGRGYLAGLARARLSRASMDQVGVKPDAPKSPIHSPIGLLRLVVIRAPA
jgi:hypothetical protein